MEIGKDKVVTGFIGHDEKSAEFDVKDFDISGDDLSAGLEPGLEDIRRLTARANTLAKNHVLAAGVCRPPEMREV